MIKRATILRMPWAVDFANGANIPLAINANMAKVMTFEASLGIAWVVTVKWTVYRCSLNSPFHQDFMIQFCVLDSQFNGGSERGGEGGGYNLQVGCRSQFGRISFYICYKFWHMELMEEREEIFLDGSLNSAKGVAASANTGGGRSKVEEGM